MVQRILKGKCVDGIRTRASPELGRVRPLLYHTRRTLPQTTERPPVKLLDRRAFLRGRITPTGNRCLPVASRYEPITEGVWGGSEWVVGEVRGVARRVGKGRVEKGRPGTGSRGGGVDQVRDG